MHKISSADTKFLTNQIFYEKLDVTDIIGPEVDLVSRLAIVCWYSLLFIISKLWSFILNWAFACHFLELLNLYWQPVKCAHFIVSVDVAMFKFKIICLDFSKWFYAFVEIPQRYLRFQCGHHLQHHPDQTPDLHHLVISFCRLYKTM